MKTKKMKDKKLEVLIVEDDLMELRSEALGLCTDSYGEKVPRTPKTSLEAAAGISTTLREKYGIEATVTIAECAEEALSLLDRNRYSVVITDLQMPYGSAETQTIECDFSLKEFGEFLTAQGYKPSEESVFFSESSKVFSESSLEVGYNKAREREQDCSLFSVVWHGNPNPFEWSTFCPMEESELLDRYLHIPMEYCDDSWGRNIQVTSVSGETARLQINVSKTAEARDKGKRKEIVENANLEILMEVISAGIGRQNQTPEWEEIQTEEQLERVLLYCRGEDKEKIRRQWNDKTPMYALGEIIEDEDGEKRIFFPSRVYTEEGMRQECSPSYGGLITSRLKQEGRKYGIYTGGHFESSIGGLILVEADPSLSEDIDKLERQREQRKDFRVSRRPQALIISSYDKDYARAISMMVEEGYVSETE